MSNRPRPSRARQRRVRLEGEASKAFDLQIEAFRHRFGRDPRPDEPVFFDPDESGEDPVPISPTKAEAAIVKAMGAAGIDPALIYAYQHTGMMITEMNLDQWSETDLTEWNEAIARFRSLKP